MNRRQIIYTSPNGVEILGEVRGEYPDGTVYVVLADGTQANVPAGRVRDVDVEDKDLRPQGLEEK